ncbi:hypothetical protein DY000_02025248 [Brassica cretica]|uniref:Uncharacterized protein n=1 Tax=Brassica cretica TaxID=69181 RepID=A0ABQ7E782_BRACR|nr:hypothetical protein DY000_02025248 [Brassica cretica]
MDLASLSSPRSIIGSTHRLLRQFKRYLSPISFAALSSATRSTFTHDEKMLLRPRCCRCEVSSTSGHCSSPRLVNIVFSTSQAYDLFISKSCSQPSPSYLCSVVADSPLSSTRCDEKCDLQHQWKSINVLHL